MTLVRIHIPSDKPASYGLAIGEAVHIALVRELGVPADDIFRVVSRETAVIADSGFLGVHRDDPVFVYITLPAGAEQDRKVAFYRSATSEIRDHADVAPRNVLITLVENSPADWSLGNGKAQGLESQG